MSAHSWCFDEACGGEVPKFDNLMEKATYWKNMADGYRTKLQTQQQQTNGTDEKFEAEMEEKLAEYEDRIRTLLSSKDKLESENDDLLIQLEETMKHTFDHINHLNDENSRLKESRDDMNDLIEVLKSKNKGLESGKKLTCDLLKGYKGSLADALEKNKFLELSLKDKELEIARLKRVQDEVRDLKGALAITVRDKVYLKQSKQEYEEAQAYEKFMKMVKAKKEEPKSEPCPNTHTTSVNKDKDLSTNVTKTTNSTTSRFLNYKNYIQGMVLGFGSSQEPPKAEECELSLTKKVSPGKHSVNIDGCLFAAEGCTKVKSPAGLSDHYVDMINNLSTDERVAYSIKQKKKANKLI